MAEGQNSGFVFWKIRVQISVRRPAMLTGYCLVPPDEFRNTDLKYATTAFFRVSSLDATLTQLLEAHLNKPQTSAAHLCGLVTFVNWFFEGAWAWWRGKWSSLIFQRDVLKLNSGKVLALRLVSTFMCTEVKMYGKSVTVFATSPCFQSPSLKRR